MERLTYDDHGCWSIKAVRNLMCKEVCDAIMNCNTCPIAEAIDRLAAYEDTGLTPAEIIELKGGAGNG